jgi:predicted phage terminase large subunit-like protein
MAQRGRPRKDAAQRALTEAIQGSYKAYCLYVHNMDFMNNPKAKEEDMKWKPSKFHQHLCDTVQSFIERPTDKAYEILIINTPPQHGKSTTVTETLLSWYIMKRPDNSVIQVSYGDDLAERFGKRNLEKVKEFGNVFGVEVDPKKATSREFQILNHKGRVISKGIGSGLTGHSGHLIVIDDPIKNRVEADSERTRESIWNEFMDSILTRTQAGSKIILIMTRWHEDDLAGRILQQMPNVVTYVNYECECESENDPLERRRKTEDRMGEALCPEIGKGDAWLREFKAAYVAENGRRSWEALYQGHPTIQEGNILQKKWWQKYDVEDYYEGKLRFDQLIMTVDATFKDSEKNDYVAIEVWGKRENRFYLVDLVNEHLSFSNTCHRIRLLQAKHPKVMGVYIEDAANGPAILDHMRHEISGLIPIKPDKASKEARVWAVEPLVEAECVYVPKDKDWHHDFIEQCAKFPNDKHDDMVDAMSMALTRLHFSTKGWIRRKVEEATGWNLPSDMPKKKIDVGRKIHRI